MLNYIKKHLTNYKSWVKILLIIPIILVLIVSFTHVISWYDITDTPFWARFYSLAIILITFSSVAASRLTPMAFFVYFILFILEFSGNVFHAFNQIDITSEAFKNWNILIQPLVELIVIEPLDHFAQMRILAVIQGGTLPLIGLICFSFLFYLNDKVIETPQQINNTNDNSKQQPQNNDNNVNSSSTIDNDNSIEEEINDINLSGDTFEKKTNTPEIESSVENNDFIDNFTGNILDIIVTGDTEEKNNDFGIEQNEDSELIINKGSKQVNVLDNIQIVNRKPRKRVKLNRNKRNNNAKITKRNNQPIRTRVQNVSRQNNTIQTNNKNLKRK